MPLEARQQGSLMRIVCPSCQAQYEIDAQLLPEEGREVQCSACGNIWYQEHPAASRAFEPAGSRAEEVAEAAEEEVVHAHEAVAPERDEYAAEPDEEETVEPSPEPAVSVPPPKPVDAKVLGILREEAEYEATVRAREAGGIETQPELGLLGAAPWPSNSAGSERAPEPSNRRPRRAAQEPETPFPDIEDISETLEPLGVAGRSRARRDAPVPETEAEARRSFLGGLILPIAVALILVALYLAAPALSAAVPALEPAFSAYTGLVDQMRRGLANLIGF